MKYYIDFEASEAEQKIISIGCIREDGKEFYSLVHTDDPITDRIESITEISQEDIDKADSIDDVFTKFFDWCNEETFNPEFICYGDGDLDFVNNTFYDAKAFKASSMLGYLYMNLYDCSDEIKTHFCVNKTISLEKLAMYYDPNLVAQNHNALDDAKLLKMVYEGIKKGTNKERVFNEYMDPNKMPYHIKKVVQIRGNQITKEFSSVAEAVEWINAQPNDKGPQYTKDAEEKLKKAAKIGGKYFGYNWRIL